MATLLSAVTSNGAGSGASHSGPCSVFVPESSVFDGAEVWLQAADTDTVGDYAPLQNIGVLRQAGWVNVDLRGTYYLRAYVNNVGSSTNLTMKTTQ